MAMTKKLYLEFEDYGGNTKTLSVDEPKASLDSMTVASNAQAIITANVIDSKGHDLKELKSAYTREVVTTKIV